MIYETVSKVLGIASLMGIAISIGCLYYGMHQHNKAIEDLQAEVLTLAKRLDNHIADRSRR